MKNRTRQRAMANRLNMDFVVPMDFEEYAPHLNLIKREKQAEIGSMRW